MEEVIVSACARLLDSGVAGTPPIAPLPRRRAGAVVIVLVVLLAIAKVVLLVVIIEVVLAAIVVVIIFPIIVIIRVALVRGMPTPVAATYAGTAGLAGEVLEEGVHVVHLAQTAVGEGPAEGGHGGERRVGLPQRKRLSLTRPLTHIGLRSRSRSRSR